MPRKCSVCIHPQVEKINKELVNGTSLRNIAKRFSVNYSAINRHKEHLPAALTKAQEAQEVVRSIDVMDELKQCLERVKLLFDACDRWLRDADDPSRYDIGPRSADVKVTYLELINGKTIRKKDSIAYLLAKIESGGLIVERWETKHVDPRDLILRTSSNLQQQMELIAKLLGQLKDGPTVNILMAPTWISMRTSILQALEPYPEARLALTAAIQEAEHHASLVK